MTTTDSNGLIQYQTTDNVVPLQTAFNGLSSSISTSLNSTVRTFKVANDTERNALATSRPPTATNPLIVFNSASGKGYHEINTGSGWSRWIPELGPKIITGSSSGSTDVNGVIAISYSFGSTPLYAAMSWTGTNESVARLSKWTLWSKSSTALQFRVSRMDNGAWFANQPYAIDWMVLVHS